MVSIPQSGLQAFRQRSSVWKRCKAAVSIPQSGLQAFRPGDPTPIPAPVETVSIPQSGLQAFRHYFPPCFAETCEMFQSLNRAYKRSDMEACPPTDLAGAVSIPQSGLQAFRRKEARLVSILVKAVSIPQSGLQAFRPTGEH